MADQNVLADSDIAWLVGVPKPVSDGDWRAALLPPTPTALDRRGRFDLGELPRGPLGGTTHLYTRENATPGVLGDWSAGLIYTDYAGRSYRVVRCNGPHPSDHINAIEGDVIVRTPHIHRLTERYQRLARPKPDGFAEPTTAYSSLPEAVDHLIGLVNLEPVGILFL